MQRARIRHHTYSDLGKPWVMPWAPGAGLSGLFNLYPSLGDLTLAADIATTLDGPVQVVRYGALTVNAARTVTSRCRGLVVLCDSLTMGASGSLSVAGKGAAGGPALVSQNIVLPTSMVLTGKKTSQVDLFAYLAATGYFIGDPNLFAAPPPGMGDVQADYTNWPGRGTAIITAANCGLGGNYAYAAVTGNYAGMSGTAGTNGAPGGGGAGRYNAPSSAAVNGGGADGHVWGGGAGGGGSYNNGSAPLSRSASPYGGIVGLGASAGNGGAGGGVLIVIARNNVSLTAGHVFSADGLAGTTVNSTEGGGGGGGSVSLFYGGTLTGTPNLTATGASPNGGAGSTQTKTFAQMGWS